MGSQPSRAVSTLPRTRKWSALRCSIDSTELKGTASQPSADSSMERTNR